MGCPSCGSDRLKAAPLPIISVLAAPLVPRRRYRCAECRWTGWKHRLRRRGHESATLVEKTTPDAPAVWFFVAVLTLTLVVSVMLFRGCQSAQPEHSSMDVGQP